MLYATLVRSAKDYNRPDQRYAAGDVSMDQRKALPLEVGLREAWRWV